MGAAALELEGSSVRGGLLGIEVAVLKEQSAPTRKGVQKGRELH
jgi:hypothetical protein